MPVPALEAWVRARWEHYDETYVAADPAFGHAHVTLLAPFVAADRLSDDVRRGVGAVLRRYRPFSARFSCVEVFPDGMIHLVPADEGPFRALTVGLVAAFPRFPPYAGRFDDVRPHLSLDRVGPGVDLDAVREGVAPLLPAVTEVDEVQLAWYQPGASRVLATWRLGK